MNQGQYSRVIYLLIISLMMLVCVGPVLGATKIALGQKHTLMIKSDGTLWGWGENLYGQLGIGSDVPQHYPVQVGTDQWSDITAGYNHSVGIREDGTLWVWGRDALPTLGSGVFGDSNVPIQIGTDRWRHVVGKVHHTMAIKEDGTLWGWGDNYEGQLGDGTTESRFVPVQVGFGGELWSDVAVSSSKTFGIKSDGSLFEWGDSIRLPVLVSNEQWDHIAAGGFDTVVAIKRDGTLWGWGSDFYGQLGDGEPAQGWKTSPVQIGGSLWNDVDVGSDHTVGIQRDGSLWAWGNNSTGELGDGTTIQRAAPVLVSSDQWSEVIAWYDYTIAIKPDQSVWAWGRNSWGRDGFGRFGDGSIATKITPVQIGTDFWVNASAGASFATALNSDGSLWSWGSNASGQLGDGSTSNKQVPIKTGNGNWSSLDAGWTHTVAIKDDGSLWSWGTNFRGQLGDGTTEDKHSPVMIDSSSWNQVSAGMRNTMAIRSDGTLWGWGQNSTGQLANGTSGPDQLTPIQIITGTWLSVSVGDLYAMAIKSDGTLWGWGNNRNAQLGDGSSWNERYLPVLTSSDSWASVSAGWSHTMAIKSNGTLWGWGVNSAGQLGDGTGKFKDSPVQIGSDLWLSVAQGEYHSIGIKSDGTLWGWGSNYNGQIGAGSTLSSNTPILISTGKWRSVSAGSRFSIAVKDDNTLWAWGDNWSGQLGDGEAWRDTPQLLILPDTEAPTGSITINNGDTLSGKTVVTLNLSCSDNMICSSMQFSNDQLNWSDVESYSVDKLWALSDDDGEKTVYVRFFDDAGNEAIYSASILLDTEPPVGLFILNNGDSSTDTATVTLVLSCSDNIRCARMQFSNDQLNWSDVESYSVDKLWALSDGDGDKIIYARFFDDAGNEAIYFTSILLDAESPVGSFVVNNGDLSTDIITVSLVLSCSDNVRCTRMQFSNDQVSWSDLENYRTEKIWVLNDDDGHKTIYARFFDGAGYEAIYSASILLDTESPVGSLVINSGNSITDEVDVTLTLLCSDNVRCTRMQFSNDQVNWSDLENYRTEKMWGLNGGNGEKTVYVQFFDNAGNKTLYSALILLDTEPPVGLFVINNGDLITNEVDVTLTLLCSDNTLCSSMQISNNQVIWSYVESYKANKLWVLSDGDGDKTVYVRFYDGAGNEAVYSSAVKLSLPVPQDADNSSGGGSFSMMGMMLLLLSGYFRYYTLSRVR